jgi:hypothetical protein
MMFQSADAAVALPKMKVVASARLRTALSAPRDRDFIVFSIASSDLAPR